MLLRRWFVSGTVLVLLSAIPGIAFGQKVWSGMGVDTNWTTKENWVGNVAPVAGDALQFPDSGTQKSNVNNYAANTAFASIAFTGTAGGYLFTGNKIILNGNVTAANTSTQNQINFDIEMAANSTFSQTGGSFLYIYGVISGAGNVLINGSGLVCFCTDNTYGGVTNVTSGVLGTDHGGGLGAADGTLATGTVIANGAALLLGNLDVNIGNEFLTLNGALQDGFGNHTWAGPVSLGTTSTVVIPGTQSIALNGVVSGTGALTMSSGGTLTLGNSGNTFSGGVTWLGTTVLRLGAANAIPSATALTIPNVATLDVNGFPCLIAGLSGAGTILLGSGALTANQTATTSFSGPISGSGGAFSKIGTGVLTLSGTNTYTGGTFVNAGTLFINGTQQNAVASAGFGGTLGGTGSVGPLSLNNNGVVSPGLSPGIINSGNVSLSSGTFVVELNGTSPGNGPFNYDQLNVTGTVTLSGATLSGTSCCFIPNGSQLIIINNDGADPVSGTFSGLPQGSLVVISGETFTITYFGGDGNDVALIAGIVSVPALGPTAMMILAMLLMTAAALAVRARFRAGPQGS